MASHRFTVRLNDEQAAWVEQEADDRDRSQAWVLAEVVDAVREGAESVYAAPESTDAHRTAPERTDAVREQLDRIETDVSVIRDAVEPEDDANDTGSPARDSAPDPTPDASATTATPHEPTAGDSQPSLDDVLDEWSPGRTPGEREERRAVGRAVLEWLREDGGPASGSVFRDALLPEHAIEGQSETTWWRKTARPALKAAVDADLVEYREGHHDYVWTAAES